jgi:hypothetical protein
MFYSLITGLLIFIKAKRPVNQWLSTPLRGLDNGRAERRPLKRLVIAPLRYATTNHSSGQFYQDNRTASGPLSRQNCRSARPLIKPLRALINIRSVWKPANTVVTQLLRNSITTVSTGQSYQDNRSASAPLSRQDCQTLRMLCIKK